MRISVPLTLALACAYNGTSRCSKGAGHMALPGKTPTVPPPVAATVHIYRGLMDRGTTWRQRVDNPTNWAIVSCGTTVSFVLSDDLHSHVVLLLVMLFGI